MNQIKKHYEDYWDKDSGEGKKYFRNMFLKQFFKPTDHILDVGCGDGTVGRLLQEEVGLLVEGIDISDVAVKRAIKNGIKAKVVNSEDKFPFRGETFDAVFWGDNIEHLFDPKLTAKEIKRVLKKNGRLILSCPNMGYWRYRLHYFLKGQLPDTEWTGNRPWEWSHIRFFNLNILEEFIKELGFKRINKVIGASERKLDKPFLKRLPGLFGMVLILEVI